VVQQALAEAIAERTGTDVERSMLPRILAGAVTAASDVAIDQWLHARKRAGLVSLIRQALRQLAEVLPIAKSARSRAIKHRKKNK
jgi:hypothetical protein